MMTIAELTKRHTGEYAVRPFLSQPGDALPYLSRWVGDPNAHLRRLVSEGTRPLLPWAKKLDVFLDDPLPVLKLLERLRSDPSPYVRKSVANHIKDLYRLVPEKADPIISGWANRSDPAWTWIEARIAGYRVAAFAVLVRLAMSHARAHTPVSCERHRATSRWSLGASGQSERPRSSDRGLPSVAGTGFEPATSGL